MIKRFLCALCVSALSLTALAGLEPQTLSVTNYRGQTEGLYVSETPVVLGEPLLFSNIVYYAGGTNSALQDLTALYPIVAIGSGTSSLSYTCTVSSATTGLAWVRITMPTNWTAPELEFSLTNAAGTIFSYPLWKLKTRSPL